MTQTNKPDELLDQAVAKLPDSFEVPDNVWTQLESQLQPTRKQMFRKRLAPLGLVASALLVAFIVLVQRPQALAPALQNNQSAEAQLVVAYEESIARQLAERDSVLDNWPQFEHQFEIFRSAVDEIRGALRYQPDEPRLLSHLQDIYQQQLAWLQALPDDTPPLFS